MDSPSGLNNLFSSTGLQRPFSTFTFFGLSFRPNFMHRDRTHFVPSYYNLLLLPANQTFTAQHMVGSLSKISDLRVSVRREASVSVPSDISAYTVSNSTGPEV